MSENTKEKKRKCFKCGKSAAADNVKLFRFPKPGLRNILRCTLWAKYIFPCEEQHASMAILHKLHSEHRMLSAEHFAREDFRDETKTGLLLTAVPHDVERVVIPVMPPYFEPVAGASRTANENLIDQPVVPAHLEEPQAGPSGIITQRMFCRRQIDMF